MKHKLRWVLLCCLVLLIAAPVAAQEKVKVTIFVGLGTGTDPDQIPKQEALAEKFNASHDSIEIEFLIVPVEESRTRLLAMLAGGNAPQLVGPNGISTIAQFFDSWADITPFLEAEQFDTTDFYAPSLELNSYPEMNTGLPLGLFPSFVLYNIDMFDASGVDYPPSDYADTSWTMDELRNRAMLLTLDANGYDATMPEFDAENIVQWGFSDAWSDMRGVLTRWGAPGIGRPTSDDFKTATANSEEWIYGLQWFSDGMWVDHFIPNGEQQTGIESTGAAPLDSGQIAMFYTHTWYLGEALNDLPFEVGIAPAPFNQKGERIARIHADNFTIPETATNKEEAWEVMKWLTSPEQIVDVCLIYGCVPARASVADDFRAALQERFPDLDLNVAFEAINYLDAPNHESWVPEWGRVNDTLNYAYGLIASGENTDAKAVLDETNASLQQILDEYWAKQP
ncbi:MAG: extracellular solute-binding protein [Anaerolineae bacterium]|nr:extracellular solute-binding protein [Anaerolineae bacterium]MBN8617294.1 extracellular solute-binding protein [Anaerolineae bacterium]